MTSDGGKTSAKLDASGIAQDAGPVIDTPPGMGSYTVTRRRPPTRCSPVSRCQASRSARTTRTTRCRCRSRSYSTACSYSQLTVSVNGYVTFGSPVTGTVDVGQLRARSLGAPPDATVAVFWDDLYASDTTPLGGAGVRVRRARRPIARWTIEWRDMDAFYAAGGGNNAFTQGVRVTQELVLHETGVIEMHYGPRSPPTNPRTGTAAPIATAAARRRSASRRRGTTVLSRRCSAARRQGPARATRRSTRACRSRLPPELIARSAARRGSERVRPAELRAAARRNDHVVPLRMPAGHDQQRARDERGAAGDPEAPGQRVVELPARLQVVALRPPRAELLDAVGLRLAVEREVDGRAQRCPADRRRVAELRVPVRAFARRDRADGRGWDRSRDRGGRRRGRRRGWRRWLARPEVGRPAAWSRHRPWSAWARRPCTPRSRVLELVGSSDPDPTAL